MQADEGDSNSRSGRWTAEEHELFLKGLGDFGKDWKKIASVIPTRTVVQVRTHAQKFFLANKKGDGIVPSTAVTPSITTTNVLLSNKKNISEEVDSSKVPTRKKQQQSIMKKKKNGLKDDDILSLNVVDVLDAWSSGSDEGSPTSVEEMELLKAPIREVELRNSLNNPPLLPPATIHNHLLHPRQQPIHLHHHDIFFPPSPINSQRNEEQLHLLPPPPPTLSFNKPSLFGNNITFNNQSENDFHELINEPLTNEFDAFGKWMDTM